MKRLIKIMFNQEMFVGSLTSSLSLLLCCCSTNFCCDPVSNLKSQESPDTAEISSWCQSFKKSCNLSSLAKKGWMGFWYVPLLTEHMSIFQRMKFDVIEMPNRKPVQFPLLCGNQFERRQRRGPRLLWKSGNSGNQKYSKCKCVLKLTQCSKH